MSTDQAPSGWKSGRGLMIFAAVTYGVLPTIIDIFDPHHMGNPDWPPHAKLHLLWLIGMGLSLCLYSISLFWRATIERPQGIYTGAAIGACQVGAFYAAGLLSSVFGAAFDADGRLLLGFLPPALLHFLISGSLLAAGFVLATQALKKAKPSTASD